MRKYRTVLPIFTALVFIAEAAFAQPSVVGPNDLYAGMTYGDWSAVWWQYVIGTPDAMSKLFSDDNSSSFNCSVGQTAAPVFFLVGGGSQTSTAIRTCTVPQGKAIFFPIINTECSTLEPNPWHGDNEYALRSCVSGFGNATNVSSLKVTVDGAPLQNLQKARAQSPVYTFTSPDTVGILGFQGTGSSVSDGYWVLLNPLSPGKHTIHLEGSGVAADVNGSAYSNYQSVTYNLTVQ